MHFHAKMMILSLVILTAGCSRGDAGVNAAGIDTGICLDTAARFEKVLAVKKNRV